MNIASGHPVGSTKKQWHEKREKKGGLSKLKAPINEV